MTVGKFRACSLCWPVNFAGGIGKRLLAAAGLAVVFGCTTVPTDSVMPRPGDGIREYQRHLADYRSALVDSVRAVERLAGAPEKSAASAYANAQTTAHRLELVSIRARARADALEMRGAEYFQEWVEEACAATDEASRNEARARFDGLSAQFATLQQDSRRVRETGRRFFEYVRQWRATLGSVPPAGVVEKARTEFAPAAAAGRIALEAVDQLSQTLKSVESSVMKAARP